ncbi:ImmA/IrrE family metallo-endopeptidase [Listeria booriae]|uniref:ImmA/IrrE family metallo-endopeptidase n=1 Tax=Listeria booriae TaxID=1552123 RepID=A0A7X0Z8Z7_9LIST|nr:XRE family transcriptional regulator [Listeria booriae]MBC1490959.1 ImmA/IrrE family metallo-endopeptidase [Listeria booriae]MBC1491126.1 ImmA/IrrE family metallo-endopeptidase [Listeria booriae]MBC1914157.1 ImmA/IrrE family metallo-endopeptidase [Listeria booriae]MBC2178173.1 ImmA/IrrE family metallo-endopeptidase [Listeria booriae]MBC2178300.1 ImmA/IrrE family metallo-endopeptidase [Listeria booriae]
MLKKFNGEQLKKARLYRNVSLEELGKVIGVSKQMISKYEQGLSEPDLENVIGMTMKLRFPKDYFYGGSKIQATRGNTYFRSLMSTTRKEKERNILKIDYIAKIRSFMERDLEFPMLDFPDLSNFDDIEEKAAQLRIYWGLDDKPIDDAVDLLEEKGFVLTDLATTDDKIDAFSQRIRYNSVHLKNIHYVIVLGNNKKSFFRRQFDAIHELAHFVLHESIDEVEDLTNIEYKQMESEADRFAGCFLLPASGFKKDVCMDPLNLEYYKQLKYKWKVSIGAMIVRAKQLDLITGEEYQKLYKSMSKRGWLKKEPIDSLMPLQKPSAFIEGMNLLFEEGIYNKETFFLAFFDVFGETLDPSEVESLLGLRMNFFLNYSAKQKLHIGLKSVRD